MSGFNEFVRDLVLHNQLVDAAEVEKTIKRLTLTPDKDLFTALVERGLLDGGLHDDIVGLWNQAQADAAEAAAKAETPEEKLAAMLEGDLIDTSSVQLETLHDYLAFAREIGASDLHIAAESFPLVRIYGELLPLSVGMLTADDSERILFGAISEAQATKLRESFNLEYCLKAEEGRYRTTMVKQRLGYNGAFRIIPNQIPTFQSLGLPAVLTKLTEFHQGLVLITGPNGCGKSSTMAALVEHINTTRDEHIITIEDPIEYVFEPNQSHINQRELGAHTESFSRALRASLREDPDIILIGDLRDRETTSLAISAAETGHLVFASLHTTSAARTIDRLLDVFSPEEQEQVRVQVAESLNGVVCQQLIHRKKGKGMALAMEILFNTPACMANIKDRKMHQIPSVMQMGRKEGMQLLDVALQELVDQGAIAGIEAYYAAEEKERFAAYAPSYT